MEKKNDERNARIWFPGQKWCGEVFWKLVYNFFLFSGQEISGRVSLKHVYEIAQIKSQDPAFENISLQEVCKRVIGVAHTCGIEVVPHLEGETYGQFLVERKEIMEQQEKELEEARQAKMLRL